jgi:transposase-like protein
MAQQNSLTIIEFYEMFNTEEKCRQHLFKHKWPNGFKCDKCGHDVCYHTVSRDLYQCKACRYQSTITTNTVMHGAKVPLQKWFWAIYLISKDKRGISALHIQKEIEVSYPTAWGMLHKIREAMEDRDAVYQLADTVEVDESYFGGPDIGGKRGRGTSKSKVVVSVSSTDKGVPLYAKMNVVDNIDKNTISALISENIVEGSTINSDGLNVYNHLKDSKTYKYVQLIADFGSLSWVHKVISNAKAYIMGTYHGLGKKHLQSYLNEFCYRFNRRFWQNQLFDRLLEACSKHKATPVDVLTL